MHPLKDYESVVGPQVIEELYLIADRLKGFKIQNINSTAVGGGVAEILSRLIPMLNELGIQAAWNVIKGGERFYTVTKKFHNALHGKPVEISPDDFSVFNETSEMNNQTLDLHGDIIFVHDPQPIALIHQKELKSAK